MFIGCMIVIIVGLGDVISVFSFNILMFIFGNLVVLSFFLLNLMVFCSI